MNRLFKGCLFSNYDKVSRFGKKARVESKIIALTPRQHPKEQLTKKLKILEARKQFFLNEKDEKPQALYIRPTSYEYYEGKEVNKVAMGMLTEQANVKPDEQWSLEVGVVGAPNAGKSTLINYIVGQPITATSNKVWWSLSLSCLEQHHGPVHRGSAHQLRPARAGRLEGHARHHQAAQVLQVLRLQGVGRGPGRRLHPLPPRRRQGRGPRHQGSHSQAQRPQGYQPLLQATPVHAPRPTAGNGNHPLSLPYRIISSTK